MSASSLINFIYTLLPVTRYSLLVCYTRGTHQYLLLFLWQEEKYPNVWHLFRTCSHGDHNFRGNANHHYVIWGCTEMAVLVLGEKAQHGHSGPYSLHADGSWVPLLMLPRTRALHDLRVGKTNSITPVAGPSTALWALQHKLQIPEIKHLSFLAPVSSSLFYQSGVLIFELKEPFVGIRWGNMNRRAKEGHEHTRKSRKSWLPPGK